MEGKSQFRGLRTRTIVSLSMEGARVPQARPGASAGHRERHQREGNRVPSQDSKALHVAAIPGRQIRGRRTVPPDLG